MNLKIAFIGAPKVGKTAFISRHKTGEFITEHAETKLTQTTNLKFYTNKGKINITAYENCKNLEEMDAYILLIDTEDIDSILYLVNIINIIPKKPMVLCFSKCDLKKQEFNIQLLKKFIKCRYYFISAKSCYNFEKPFTIIFEQLYGSIILTDAPPKTVKNVEIPENIYIKLPREIYDEIYTSLPKELQELLKKNII